MACSVIESLGMSRRSKLTQTNTIRSITHPPTDRSMQPHARKYGSQSIGCHGLDTCHAYTHPSIHLWSERYTKTHTVSDDKEHTGRTTPCSSQRDNSSSRTRQAGRQAIIQTHHKQTYHLISLSPSILTVSRAGRPLLAPLHALPAHADLLLLPTKRLRVVQHRPPATLRLHGRVRGTSTGHGHGSR